MTRPVRFWPVPDSPSKTPPAGAERGSFQEDRDDRLHCGVDLYAPAGSRVLAVEAGTVLETGVFTLPEKNPYWNRTFYVLIEHDSGVVARYAELGAVAVSAGDSVTGGQVLGTVGEVLNSAGVGGTAPRYIRDLVAEGRTSMLHFELYAAATGPSPSYSGGNVFGENLPENLIDPAPFLAAAQ